MREDITESIKRSSASNGEIVLMFPGQGSQFTGMGKEFLLKNNEFNKYFDISSSILGENILDVINDNEGRGYLLDNTRYSQIAVYTLSCAINDYLIERGVIKKEKVKYVIGHSLGDYSALYSCGAYDFDKGAQLVVFRGRLMAGYKGVAGGNFSDSGAAKFNPKSEIMNSGAAPAEGAHEKMMMAAVLGSDINTILNILKKYKDRVFVANYNDYSQVVISGFKDDVLKAGDEIKNNGAKRVIPLKVSVASHCPLMHEVSIKLQEYLDDNLVNLPDLNYNFFSSTEVKIIKKGSVKEVLVRQLVNPVRWLESIEKIVCGDSRGELKVFIEVGPQKVLTGLLRRILSRLGREDILTFNTDTLEDIERIINET
ncbi:MAG: acyltransferase domain-containing protein [Actinobacteria bacterium]|nr:acyltransferase domain-containing protein [Actinomycetota bacterium]